MHTRYCILPTKYYLLGTTYYLLHTMYYPLDTTYYVLHTTYYIVKLHSMITVFTILGTRHYLLDYPNLHDTYNELLFVHIKNMYDLCIYFLVVCSDQLV